MSGWTPPPAAAGALVGAVRSQDEQEALPLVGPEMVTPVGFIYLGKSRASRVLKAALGLAREERWVREVVRHSGALGA